MADDTLIFASNPVSTDPDTDAQETMPDDPVSPGSTDHQHAPKRDKFDSPRFANRQSTPVVRFPVAGDIEEPHRINGQRITRATLKRDRDMLTAFN